MEMSYYEIGELMIMILNLGDGYEYYVRDGRDLHDYFKFAFGQDEELSEEELYEMEDYLWECQEIASRE